ncbi:beta-1,3-galactosyltransferase 1 [Maylandia zebra]|uniref:Hexosyltransferase n=3 Tax=Haplochromini TaxID=319058 RepID=A0A3P9CIS4_9CICH|nr:beta-1,3-galactosyltransferase 1 [Maylandia zebra]XP_026000771.1 beta-1,3-galactosyltransferase 1-like [Astatotilapia calliptera]
MKQRQEMADDQSRSWFRISRTRYFAIILVIGGVFFIYSIREITPDWNPKKWMENQSSNLWTILERQKQKIISLHSVVNDSSSTHPRTNNMTSAPEVKTETAAVAPHVSPGPYLVEYPYEYHFIINEPQKCEREKPFVVLMVPVAPNNRRDRDIIRSTWGNDRVVQGKVVTLFFLLGLETGPGAEQVQQQMLQESNKYHDLIQSNFVDCYKNLTIKTMVILEWLTAHCSGASYAMKIDSDMFLNVHNLVNMLLNAQKTNYMTGLVTGWGTVVRDPSSKWYVPSDIYAPAFYPVYALGLGYIMSLDLPKKLTEASRHVKALYIEDVYLGMLMHHLGISPTYPPSGDYFHVFPLAYNRCHFSRIVATTTHPFTNRVDIWKDLKKPGPC